MKSIPDRSADTDDADDESAAPRERPNRSRLPGAVGRGGGGGRGNGRKPPAPACTPSNVVSPGVPLRPGINHSSLDALVRASGVTTSAAGGAAYVAKSGSRKTRSTAGFGCRGNGGANEVPVDEVDVSGSGGGIVADEGASASCVGRERMLSFDVDPPADGRGWRHRWVSRGVIGRGRRGRTGWMSRMLTWTRSP